MTHFILLAELKKLLPPKEHIRVQRSRVVTMKLLLKDEKQKNETTDILSQLFSDGNLKGTNLVIVPVQIIQSV